MITVIATGFDGGKKRNVSRHEATGVMDSSVTGQPSRERDFLEELQRQRDEVADDGAYPSTPAQRPNEDQAAAVVAAPRVERSVGDSSASKRTATTYDADDLEIPSFLRRK